MGVLGKLFGIGSERSAELWPPRPGKPSYADAVPGKVSVQFFAHDNVDGFSGNFLSAVTEGLVRQKQRELVVTLRLNGNEDPTEKMRDLVRFFATVHAWAREGNRVDVGGLTQFGPRGLFGRAESGLLYTDARPISGVRLPERALSAVAVDANEIRAAQAFGVYRVLTRIGLQLRLFPFPTWTDLERPSAVTARESESLLARMPRIHAPSVSFVMQGNVLRVSLPSDTTELMRNVRSLPGAVPFALLTRPATSANAILVWSPGQEEESGMSPDGSDGSRRSGSTLVVVPSGKHADEVRTFEDGYSLTLSHDSWGQLAAALAVEYPFSLTTPSGVRFELAWPPAPHLGQPRNVR